MAYNIKNPTELQAFKNLGLQDTEIVKGEGGVLSLSPTSQFSKTYDTYKSIYQSDPNLNDPIEKAKFTALLYPKNMPSGVNNVDLSTYNRLTGNNSSLVEKQQLGSEIESINSRKGQLATGGGLRVLEKMLQAKQEQGNIGSSNLFNAAGIKPSYATLSQNLSQRGSEIGQDIADLRNLLTDTSYIQKNEAAQLESLLSNKKARYDEILKGEEEIKNTYSNIALKMAENGTPVPESFRKYIGDDRFNAYNVYAQDAKNQRIQDELKNQGAEYDNITGEYKTPQQDISLDMFDSNVPDYVPEEYRDHLEKVSNALGLPPSLVAAQIKQESGWNTSASNDKTPSRERSYGLGQINLNAHPGITKEQATNPIFAISFVADRLKKMIDKYGVYEGIQAYNTPGAVGSDQLKKYANNIIGYAGLDMKAPKKMKESEAITKMTEALNGVDKETGQPFLGDDGFLSPEDYAIFKKVWQEAGFTATSFDTKFKGYRNPKNNNYNVGGSYKAPAKQDLLTEVLNKK